MRHYSNWEYLYFEAKFTSTRFKHFAGGQHIIYICNRCGDDSIRKNGVCPMCGSTVFKVSVWKKANEYSMSTMLNRFGTLSKGELANIYNVALSQYKAFDFAVPEQWLKELCWFLEQNKSRYPKLLNRRTIFWTTFWVYSFGEPFSVCSDVNKLLKDYWSR